VLWLIVLAIVALLAVIIVRAALFTPKEEETVAPAQEAFSQEDAVRILQEMIQIKTVSYRDGSLEDEREFARFDEMLPKWFPGVFSTCSHEKVSPRSWLFCWKGESSDNPGVLMAHYDVVPANEDAWEEPPFSGTIRDGVLWGRGAIDTKITVMGVLQSVETLISEGFQPQNDLYLAFAGNEEISGDGAPAIVRWFEKKGIKPAFVLDEGGAVVEKVFPGVSQPAAMVGIAEKGPTDVTLTIETAGGHASTPPPRTSVGRLAKAVTRIEKHPFPFTLTPPVKQLFDRMGRRSTFLYRVIFANLWCFAPLLNLICKLSGGELNALVRTTVAFPQMQGSSASNVLPPKATVGANLRLIPGQTVEDAREYLQKQTGDNDIRVDVVFGMNPSPVSTTEGAPWEHLEKAIRATWQGVIVTPYLMLACSDSRHYGQICDRVYRFSAMALTKEERAMIHGNNERIPLETIAKTVTFYRQFIKMC